MTDLFDVGARMPNMPSGSLKGMAGAPGGGPTGETCGTCRHKVRRYHHDKYYLKCALMEPHWTHGAGSDIKAKYGACKYWEPRERKS